MERKGERFLGPMGWRILRRGLGDHESAVTWRSAKCNKASKGRRWRSWAPQLRVCDLQQTVKSYHWALIVSFRATRAWPHQVFESELMTHEHRLPSYFLYFRIILQYSPCRCSTMGSAHSSLRLKLYSISIRLSLYGSLSATEVKPHLLDPEVSEELKPIIKNQQQHGYHWKPFAKSNSCCLSLNMWEYSWKRRYPISKRGRSCQPRTSHWCFKKEQRT